MMTYVNEREEALISTNCDPRRGLGVLLALALAASLLVPALALGDSGGSLALANAKVATHLAASGLESPDTFTATARKYPLNSLVCVWSFGSGGARSGAVLYDTPRGTEHPAKIRGTLKPHLFRGKHVTTGTGPRKDVYKLPGLAENYHAYAYVHVDAKEGSFLVTRNRTCGSVSPTGPSDSPEEPGSPDDPGGGDGDVTVIDGNADGDVQAKTGSGTLSTHLYCRDLSDGTQLIKGWVKADPGAPVSAQIKEPGVQRKNMLPAGIPVDQEGIGMLSGQVNLQPVVYHGSKDARVDVTADFASDSPTLKVYLQPLCNGDDSGGGAPSDDGSSGTSMSLAGYIANAVVHPLTKGEARKATVSYVRNNPKVLGSRISDPSCALTGKYRARCTVFYDRGIFRVRSRSSVGKNANTGKVGVTSFTVLGKRKLRPGEGRSSEKLALALVV